MTESMDVSGSVNKALNELFWERSLYSPVALKEGDEVSRRILFGVLFDEIVHDAHCVHCGRDSPFRRDKKTEEYDAFVYSGIAANWKNEIDPVTQYWYSEAKLICQRNSLHVYRFHFSLQGKTLQKIGQFPSMEDISGADVKRFRSVLDKSLFSDLHRAGGLYSHGIGIGSFVYLRRIFESLITSHHATYVAEHGEIEGFNAMRMMEKVAALSSTIPSSLIEYKNVYGILSKGVHELDEDTCKKYFPAVKAMIIAILEQDLQKKAKAETEARLKQEMNLILGEIG
ncbi:hypothetical protein RHIZ_07545 [Rhizobium skierniewicense]|uniref:hypothetical protein n=1 Tax=Rhizobium skierniewicense TaxID=984260 RepID=UPI001FACD651|nr:hypothetical protein [Rhizobium skierniewicense]MCI9865791.1 hypothetical protein [Rhizobium skierniewicense]